jgi:hypothetical protein
MVGLESYGSILKPIMTINTRVTTVLLLVSGSKRYTPSSELFGFHFISVWFTAIYSAWQQLKATYRQARKEKKYINM